MRLPCIIQLVSQLFSLVWESGLFLVCRDPDQTSGGQAEAQLEDTYIYIYTYMYVCIYVVTLLLCMYIYIYVCVERERVSSGQEAKMSTEFQARVRDAAVIVIL